MKHSQPLNWPNILVPNSRGSASGASGITRGITAISPARQHTLYINKATTEHLFEKVLGKSLVPA
jgi:hypothetical protein